MTTVRFFKVIADSYQESEQKYIKSEGRFDLSQDKGYQSSETGEFRKVITGLYIKSLKLEEFELELEKEGAISANEQYNNYAIGKSLGKYKIPLPLDENGKMYVDSLDFIPANILLYDNGTVKEVTSWDIRNGLCLKKYFWKTRREEGVSISSPKEYNIHNEFLSLVDFSRF